MDDIGGAPLRGFTLTFRKEFADWEEVQLDRRVNSHLLEDLQCGTSYQFTIVTFNKIGTSVTSAIEVAKTQGKYFFDCKSCDENYITLLFCRK